jgi:hypothetical protein
VASEEILLDTTAIEPFFLLLKVAISLSDVEGITLQHIFVHAKSSKRSHKGQNLFSA